MARRKRSFRSIARKFGISLSTVQRWVGRAVGQRLERVDWEDRLDTPHRTRRTPRAVEREVLRIRHQLKCSILGECGAAAIRRELEHAGLQPCPSIRTIGRILQRNGALDGRRRCRRPPPPGGWYLTKLADRQAELDSFDTIEGLAIRGGSDLTVLTGISLHGGLAVAWPEKHITARHVVTALVEHWRAVGLPKYAQFDNDNRFVGPKQHLDAIGRVLRCCLSLGVTPVIVPPNEMGFQAHIESFNGRWQSKVWSRRRYRSVPEIQRRSRAYIDATRAKASARIDTAPPRRVFPRGWRLDLQKHPHGMIVFLRRTDDSGRAQILGRTFLVDRYWTHRLVRAQVDLDLHCIRFYALRRRDPTETRLLREIRYSLPRRPFQE